MARRSVMVMIAAMCGACGDEAPIADREGVVVVTTTIPTWESAQPWRIGREAALRIGLVDGDARYLFGDIKSVIRLDGGVILVADGLSRELRFFDSDGTFLRAVGREGQGPGEFQSIAWVARCNGDLFAYDRRQRRVSVWSESGDLRESFTLQLPRADRIPYRARCGPKGTFLLAGWGEPPSMPMGETFMYYEQRAPVWLVDPRSGAALDLGDYVTSERVRHVTPSTGGGGSGPHPFSRSVVFALDEEHLYVGSSERLEVEVWDSSGKALRLMRGPDDDLSVEETFISGYRSARMGRPDSLMRSRLERADMPMPPRLPAYMEILVDELGYVWVERFRRPWAGANRWGVFSPEGIFHGHVEMPDGFQVMSIARDYVLGVSRDEFDVERVELYRLDRVSP